MGRQGKLNRGDGKVFTFLLESRSGVNHIKSDLQSRRIKLEIIAKAFTPPSHPANPVLPLDSTILSKDWMRRL